MDFVFVTLTQSIKTVATRDGVESFYGLPPSRITLDEIAFPSLRQAARLYAARA